ncbi:hypothetical protein LCGC14_2293480, partial [marine sediment metagenome]
GDVYEGGINYPAVKVIKVVESINREQLAKIGGGLL